MPAEWVISTANILQGSVPLLSLVAYIPQWATLIRTKSSVGISVSSWALWTLSAFIAVFYAVVQYLVTGQGVALIFSTATIMGFVIITVVLVVRYRYPAT